MSDIGNSGKAKQLFLAFDLGQKRTGVATGNRITGTASSQRTLMHASQAALLAEVASLIKQWQPDALVLGIPFHPDGAAHENTRRAQKFARQLRGRHGLPVHEVDERYSTTEAIANGARDADAESACIILTQFLRGIA